MLTAIANNNNIDRIINVMNSMTLFHEWSVNLLTVGETGFLSDDDFLSGIARWDVEPFYFGNRYTLANRQSILQKTNDYINWGGCQTGREML